MIDLVGRGAQLVSASNLGNYSLDMLPYISHNNLKSKVPTMLPSFEGFTVGSVASCLQRLDDIENSRVLSHCR
jgi:hypothetical protein